jgi:hypothetical protein
MHTDILDLLDDTLSRLLTVRGELAATRRVKPGERQAAVVEAITAADEFAATASSLLDELNEPGRAAEVHEIADARAARAA